MPQPVRPFKPYEAATVSLSVTTSSDRVALGVSGTEFRLYNAGSATVFVEFGDSSVTAATATGMPIPAGGVEVFRSTVHTDTHVAAITSSGTATLYATPGEGT